VNYSTLTAGVSCESSQPVRETFVLRLAVCRSSSSFENGPSTWHFAIGCITHPLIALYRDFVKFYLLLPSRLPALVRNCTKPVLVLFHPTGTPLLSSYRESCIPAFLPIVIEHIFCKKLYKGSGFHLSAVAGELPANKVKKYML
jgi:hypothetical protein